MKTPRLSPLLAPSLLLACALPSLSRADLVNRWSFNNAAGAAAAGTTMADSIGGAIATVRGTGATFTGTALTLPGTTTGNQAPAAISAYIDLPNGLISSKTSLTVELWATPVSYKNFQRLLDFGRVVQAGDGAPGEITGLGTTAPGATQASDGLTLTLNRNTANNLGQQRFEGKLNGVGTVDATGLYRIVDTNIATTAGTEYHYVMTFEDGVGAFGAAGGRLSWYRNDTLAATTDVGFRLSQIEDVNNWLGRSLWSSDSNANASYNEVRVYNHAMTQAEITASLSAGPNPFYTVPSAVSDSATLHRGLKVLVPVLANDTGSISPGTLTVVQPPSFGTAVADTAGNILYSHTTGSPATDSFTYRVSGPAGSSAPATVTLNFSNSLRISNNGFNVPSTPPPLAIQLSDAVTGLSNPVGMASPPGDTQRLFIVQKGGLIRLVPNITATVPALSTFLDLPTLLTSRGEAIATTSEQGLLGLAFHPNYASNRQFFVFYSVTKSGSVYERVSRFTTQAANPALADTASELILIEQLDEATNHNGGDLHFGPDGYLYVSLGDEGGQNDQYNNSQTITKDFFSGLLRIDVDKKPGNLAPNTHASIPLDAGVARYSVPADNPFVGATTFNGAAIIPSAVRTEFWAVGLRNPWRFSFDPANGDLWVGDVGGSSREEVNIITKGGNYGWAHREGTGNGPKSGTTPANFDTLYHKLPLYDYGRVGTAGDANFKGNSISGGIVYRGTRFPSLTGSYIFADYVSGNLWSLVRNGANPPTVTRLAGEVGLVGFGRDPSNGDVLIADHDGARLLRLTLESVTTSYPAKLSDTKLFADLTDLTPAPGLVPYAPNLAFWSDHAIKSRWFTIPNGTSTMTPSLDGSWTYPAGQIWVKHFDIETTRGNPAVKKRLETRLLVKNASGAYGVSYRWNEAGTDATLVPDGGADFTVNITVNGAPYAQQWRIPSRAECLACHTPQAGHALSFNTRQLNLANTLNGFSGNQLQLLLDAGYLSASAGLPNQLPRHLRPGETAFPAEARVRSYLDVNCGYCHRDGGTATPSAWDGRVHLSLAATGLINGAASNNGGNALNKLVVPGDTARSIVLNRVALANGFTRMPPLGSSELDQSAIALLTEWINTSLPVRQTFADWRATAFGSASSPEGDPAADPDGDGVTNQQEYLLGTQPLAGGILVPQVTHNGSTHTVSLTLPANRSAVIETSTDLTTWTVWDAPGNAGLPHGGGTVSITGPSLGEKQFFRVLVTDN